MSFLGARLKHRLRAPYGWWLRHTSGNRVHIDGRGHAVTWRDARLHHCKITLSGENNRLEFGEGAMLWGASIQLTGSNLHCSIGAHVRVRGGSLIVTDRHSALQIGAHTTMTGPMLVAQSGGALTVGRDCMIAYGADIRCSDGHSVFDGPGGELLNPAADVTLADHVWVGIHSQILKGVTVGPHAIVAARAVVTRSVAPATVVAGNPARPIRQGVTWERRRPQIVPGSPRMLTPLFPSPARFHHDAAS